MFAKNTPLSHIWPTKRIHTYIFLVVILFFKKHKKYIFSTRAHVHFTHSKQQKTHQHFLNINLRNVYYMYHFVCRPRTIFRKGRMLDNSLLLYVCEAKG